MATFIAICVGLPSTLGAQTNYENYTFTSFAGPSGSPGWFDGSADSARFSSCSRTAVDSAGNVYVADTLNHTIRKIMPNGMVTTLAGLANASGTNDGAGSAARFYQPGGVAVDNASNVYVGDTYNHTIRKITPAGVVTTFAGIPSVSGTNDGAAATAHFHYPAGVAVDTNGNLFVADTYNHTIRKITPAGVVSTLAGLAGQYGTNNGTGRAARFDYPYDVAVDTKGNLYVADTYNDTIRMITSSASVTTLAGKPGVAGSANGTGTSARFYYPFGVTVDTNGNLFVADTYNHTIRKVTSAGVVTTVAGTAGSAGSTNATGSAALFNYPTGMAVDNLDNVFVADLDNSLIRQVTSSAVVTTYAGSGAGLGTNNGTTSDARFNYVSGVAVYGGTNIYVADLANDVIRKITSAGVVTTLAGQAGSAGSSDGTGSSGRFNQPIGLAVDTNGNIFVADTYNDTIRKVTPAGVVTLLAGSAGIAGSNNGTGSSARFNLPFGVAVGTNSTVYVADTYNHCIRKITAAGAVTTLAGSPTLSGTNDGAGTAARFNYPEGIARDTNSNLYVADSSNYTIRKIDPSGVVTTLAGVAGVAGNTDGTNRGARFNSPFGVAVDPNGNILVTDRSNHTIRKVTPTGVVTTLAGRPGNAGFIDGTGSSAVFNFPEGVAVDSDGTVYVADALNHAIRRGYAAPPDVPVIDLPVGSPGVVCHLSLSNLTTTSWLWNIVRYPAASLSQLSSTTNQNTTFIPDIADQFAIRFQGTDVQGRQAVWILDLVSRWLIEPKFSSIQVFGPDVVLKGAGGAPGVSYSVLLSTNLALPITQWNILPGNTFDNSGGFSFTNEVTGPLQVYRLRVP